MVFQKVCILAALIVAVSAICCKLPYIDSNGILARNSNADQNAMCSNTTWSLMQCPPPLRDGEYVAILYKVDMSQGRDQEAWGHNNVLKMSNRKAPLATVVTCDIGWGALIAPTHYADMFEIQNMECGYSRDGRRYRFNR
ncbi:unnamed protein product [Caenorhabditis bovis]|uniref:Uncharacterized protein n=1 Tax=Caenorhabditis bovis TaxID=2654633 RepID=A0A8S1EER8_9PELO|nr:unnamed protein product [Caenorhabditis bovis]CAB3398298.1 unnamed protein product [Caenorhabditis bovis]